jgi:hypothetical protein
LVGLLFGLLVWGFLRLQHHKAGAISIEASDAVLTGLLVLATFALGVFLTYMVIVLG